MDNYLTAKGGEEKVSELEDIKMVLTTETQGNTLEIMLMGKAPNMQKTIVSIGGNAVMTHVFNGTEASIQQMGQSVPVNDNQKKDLAFESAIVSEIAIMVMGLEAELTGVETIEGANAYAVEITKPYGKKTIYYYAANTGLKLRTSTTVQGPQGEMVQNTDMADYQEIGAVKFTYTITLPMGPTKMTATAESIDVNTGIEDGEFAVQ